MAEIHAHTAAFHGASFHDADLFGATFRECDLRDARIVASWLDGLRVSGFAGRLGPVFVEGIDVTPFVSAELDRLHPERVLLRTMRSADDHRSAAAQIEALWAGTIARAGRLPDAVRKERVEHEWSLTETVRHLVFATDCWIGAMVLLDPMPYHRIGLPNTDHPDEAAPAIGIDLSAQPSWEEALAAWAGRRARLDEVLEGLTDALLDEERTAAPAPHWGEETHSVRDCLGTLLGELAEHHRYAVRDLAVLDQRVAGLGQ